ncbi:MAG: class I SAM-dependent methyltransferase [Desulfovibrio sp.]|nr:class I SAM-dependent methyltransferase [Desulfovibrio sp.]
MNSYRLVKNYLQSLPSLSGKTVLDIPCGAGKITAVLRDKGADVLPYDLFPETFQQSGDAYFADLSDTLPINDATIDIIVCQEGIEHLPNQIFALQEFHRVLKKNGVLLLMTPNISNIAGRLAQFAFESQILREGPESTQEAVWGVDNKNCTDEVKQTRYYYGHIFLSGIQRLRTLLYLAGFDKICSISTHKSKASLFMLPIFFPVIALLSLNMTIRFVYKSRKNKLLLKEKYEQLRYNLSLTTLLNKKIFFICTKL